MSRSVGRATLASSTLPAALVAALRSGAWLKLWLRHDERGMSLSLARSPLLSGLVEGVWRVRAMEGAV